MSSENRGGSEETRARILEAALELVTTRGAGETTLAEIAREAGVSRQAIYLHFGSRTKLFVAMVNQVDATGDLPVMIRAVTEASTGIEAADALLRSQVDHNPQIRELADAIDADRLTEPAAAAAWNDRMQSRHRGCERIVRRLADEGALAPEWNPRDAADFLWTLTSYRTWRDLVVDRGWPPRRYLRHLQRVVRAVLLKSD